MEAVCLLMTVYLVALFGRIVLSWFPISPGSPLTPVFSALYTITEPVLGPLRRVLPPLMIGGAGIDLSPLVIILAFRVIQASLRC